VGTIDAHFKTHRDVLGTEPRFDFFNPRWPVFSSNYQGPVARVLGSEIDNSHLGAATEIICARVCNSIVRRGAVIEEGVEIEDCIIMDCVRVRSEARLRRTIVDRHNLIEKDARIGFDIKEDRKHYTVSPNGIVVVPGTHALLRARRPGLRHRLCGVAVDGGSKQQATRFVARCRSLQ
jgi:glucose-1-phosphate adenylyltransferase